MNVPTQTAAAPTDAGARIAGALYLLIILFGIIGEVLVRGKLVVAGDGATTVGNIMASEMLFRAGFVADSIMLLSDVAIAILFYVLLNHVNNTLALMAAAFRLIQAAILGANLLNHYAVLLMLHGSGAAMTDDQLHSQVMLLLDMHAHGYDLGLIFFALSNFILGYLVVRSKLFPALLGYGLQAAAVTYLIGSYTRFLVPGYTSLVEPMYVIPLVAELSFCLWLLFRGVGSHGRKA